MGLFLIFMLTPWFDSLETATYGRLLLGLLGGGLGILGTPLCLFLWLGMIFFCLNDDRSPIVDRILWLAVFFTTAFFGAAAYFFMVYRKQVQEAMSSV